MAGLSYITTCNLCGQQFTHAGLAELLKHNLPAAVKVFDAFKQHIETKHKPEDMRAQLAAQALIGLLRMQHFSSQDESAMQLRDYQRWQIKEMVTKNHCGDDKILQQVEALNLGSDQDRADVTTALTMLRDILEERGRFQPKMPGEPQANPASKSARPQLVV